ncbi:TRAP transporter substrate-binding protein DctP [Agromyces mangrovi Wang et al. 2018]|uniref:TRAP transporter substrate-binding protein DctP n=1 Tax=Agromyces mangrovi TaxID=1858653 RepID=UPI0025728A82|nr:TRAP transporter substrate-binding protein DctP [Agromyces mangrovi]BDZ65360.1 ABC transporter substrate-binding protein [Agromyces mangrovi]
MQRRTQRATRLGTAAAVPLVVVLVAGCASGGGDTTDPGDGDASNPEVTLRVATSQPETAPNYYCGVELLKERLEDADVGLTVELFPASALGPDTERLTALQAGDIDIDLQGSPNLATIWEPLGTVEAAYAWDSLDDFYAFYDGAEGEQLQADWTAASDLTFADPWLFGTRTFSTVDAPITSPDDLPAVPIRFPDSPQFLANAEAMGANVVTIAYEEVYVSLQQGIAAGQENPIPATHNASYDEVLNTFSLNEHQYGLHWVTVSNVTLDKMSEEQQELLFSTVKELREEVRGCEEADTEELLDEYRANPDFTVVEREDIDLDAFREMAEEYFLEYYDGETLELYETIRGFSG